MLLVQGVLLALLERAQSGRGQKISISLFDTAVAMQSLEAASLLNYNYETRWFDRSLNFAAKAADGWLTVLGFFRPNPLQLVCQALEISDLSAELGLPTDREQLARRDEISELLAPSFLKFTVEDAVARLQAAGLLCAPVLTYDQTLRLPQVANNGMLKRLSVPGQADMTVVDHPLRLSRTPHELRSPPPKLGQHTHAVLAEIGLSDEQIALASGSQT
jgi:crotonobetainyl-CoA:carnitine CoA-transferase CaiB-like acyl-CoA transferase